MFNTQAHCVRVRLGRVVKSIAIVEFVPERGLQSWRAIEIKREMFIQCLEFETFELMRPQTVKRPTDQHRDTFHTIPSICSPESLQRSFEVTKRPPPFSHLRNDRFYCQVDIRWSLSLSDKQ